MPVRPRPGGLGLRRTGSARHRTAVILRADAVVRGRLVQGLPAPAWAQPGPVLGQGEGLSTVLRRPPRLAAGRRPDQLAVQVVLVQGDGGRLTAVELRRGDTEPVGGLYPSSVERLVSEAITEKGTRTSPSFRSYAVFANSMNCE